jgi:uncharacterized protein (DUF2235 family)
MKTLVVCLDGTNQIKEQPDPTNIARIFDSLGGQAVQAGNGSYETNDGPPLTFFGKYLPGVGTQGSLILKILGNAFGDGIAEPIVRGYTFLSRNYQAGDRIILTGFSRGATAARALAGLVAGQGLLDPDPAKYDVNNRDVSYLRAAAAWYLYRSPHPDLANSARLDLIAATLFQLPPKLTPADFVAVANILAVGVFDTVSSLGLPHVDFSGKAVFDFTIMNTTLSDKVLNGFHALAADETRDLFAPTYWADRAGVDQQVFPGVHSNVGGGYPERGLSDGSLDWMLDRLNGVLAAAAAPQAFVKANVAPAVASNPIDIARDDAITIPFKDTPRRPRNFPHTATPSTTTIGRWLKPTEVYPSMQPKPYKATGTYTDGTPIYRPPPGAG